MTVNSVVFLFLVVTFTVVLCAAQYEHCKVPKKVVNNDFNTTGVDPEGYYFPLGNKNDTNIIKQMVDGTSLNPDEDLVKLCLRMRMKENNIYIDGNGNKTIPFTCENVGGKSWILECKQPENTKGSNYNHKSFITLTDNKSFFFVVRCFETGHQGWSVISTKKVLQGDTEIQVLEHARLLGFDTADALPLSYKKCGTKKSKYA